MKEGRRRLGGVRGLGGTGRNKERGGGGDGGIIIKSQSKCPCRCVCFTTEVKNPALSPALSVSTKSEIFIEVYDVKK